MGSRFRNFIAGRTLQMTIPSGEMLRKMIEGFGVKLNGEYITLESEVLFSLVRNAYRLGAAQSKEGK